MTYPSETEKHNICLYAIEAKKEIEVKFLELGALLHRIKEERLYEAGWTSWEEYALELKLSLGTISKLIRIYQVFVLRFKFSPGKIAEAGGWTVVAELLPDVSEKTTKEQVQGWLGEAAEMPRTDLHKTILERRNGVEMADCDHKDTYKIKICRGCGERWQI